MNAKYYLWERFIKWNRLGKVERILGKVSDSQDPI